MTNSKNAITDTPQRTSEELEQLFKQHSSLKDSPEPDEARRIMAGKVLKRATYTVKDELSSFDNLDSNIQSFAAPGAASNTVQSPASITELARALMNDVDLIFYHVYNQIEYYPTFGLQKGALGTLIDGIGNPFDQCQLLVELLTEAGYTANYQFGDIDLSASEISDWLGTDNTNIGWATNVLLNGGIPHTAYYTGSEWRVKLSHCWVKVTIDSSDFVFDPSYKSYTNIEGIDIASAMAYSRNSLIGAAETGATKDPSGDWIQDIGYDEIKTELNSYSANLANYIENNHSTASMDEIIGGRTINQISQPIRIVELPYLDSGVAVTTWVSIPNNYRTLVEVQGPAAGIDETFYGDELYGRRLTVWFNSSNLPELRLDGNLITTGTVIGPGGWLNFNVRFVHPYATTAFDEWVYPRTRNGYPLGQGTGKKIYWLLGIALGGTNKSMVDFHQDKVAEAKAMGASEFDEAYLGSQLAELFYTYQAESTATADMLGRMTKCRKTFHHWVMAVGRDDEKDIGFFDATSPRLSTLPLMDVGDDWKWYSSAWAMHANALERLAVEQFTGTGAGIGINSVIAAANDSGIKIYRGDKNNWTADIEPNLTNYGSTAGTGGILSVLNQDFIVAIPESGEQTIGSQTVSGFGFLGLNGGASGFVGILKGGAAPWDEGEKCKCKPCEEEESDPVGLNSGAFKYRQIDMSLGSSSFPYKLAFRTEYSSIDRFSDGPLGVGWSHNWQFGAGLISEPFRGYGSGTPIEAVASIVSFYSCFDLSSVNALPVTDIVTAWLVTDWWCSQLSQNVISAETIEGNQEFVVMPDGAFRSTENEGWQLSEIVGAYTVTSPYQVKYIYNLDGELVSIEFPDGLSITLSYNLGQLTSITNGLGRTLSISYSGDKITNISDGNGRSVSYQYDLNGQLEKITDLEGEDTTFTYADIGLLESYYYPENPTSPMVTNTYDSLGRVKSQIDVNGEQQNFYFAGWRTEFVNALGDKIIRIYDKQGNAIEEHDEQGFVTTFDYDHAGRVVKKVMPEGNVVSWAYDSNDNIISETRSSKPGSSLQDIVETFSYHPQFNKISSHQDGNGNETKYFYDSLTGKLVRIERAAIGLDVPTARMTYNSRGQILSFEDETGLVTQFTYDSSNETLQSVVVDSGSGGLNLTTNFEFNDWGDVTGVTDPNGSKTNYIFDKMRRLTQIVNALPFGYLTNVEYDKSGNRRLIERQTGDSSNPWQTFEAFYNVANQAVSVKDPLGNELATEYDELRRVSKETDPESRAKKYYYDQRNSLVKVIEPSLVNNHRTSYTPNGLKGSVEDANGNVTEYTYDGFDRISKTSYADGTEEQILEYDKNGSVIKVENRSGQIIDFEFDALSRITKKSPAGLPEVTYAYDLSGRLVSIQTPIDPLNFGSGQWIFGYDSAGRLVSEEAPDGKTTSFELDSNGNVTKITYPDSYFVEREFDELNRLTDIKLNGSSTSAVQFTYDDLSRRSTMTLANGVQTSYSYEINDALSSIEHLFVGSNLEFGYTFNGARQLLSQTVSHSQNILYPSTGVVEEYTSNESNQYTSITTNSITVSKSYDSNGCITDDGVWSYTYDSEKRLSSATDGTSVVRYNYDPFNRLIEREVDGNKVHYTYNGWQRIADYNAGSGALISRYIYGTNMNEPLIKVASNGDLTYMHADRLGSIVALSDETGAVVERISYSPWGARATSSDIEFGFAGQMHDLSTGAIYAKMRFYLPSIGRFAQPDFLGYFDDLNLYTYVSNDPLNNLDPFGLWQVPGVDTPYNGWKPGDPFDVMDPEGFREDVRKYVKEFMCKNGMDPNAPKKSPDDVFRNAFQHALAAAAVAQAGFPVAVVDLLGLFNEIYQGGKNSGNLAGSVFASATTAQGTDANSQAVANINQFQNQLSESFSIDSLIDIVNNHNGAQIGAGKGGIKSLVEKIADLADKAKKKCQNKKCKNKK